MDTELVNSTRQDLTNSSRNVKQDIIPHFTKDEMIDLLRHMPSNWHGIMFQFAWRTGVRVTELISVTKGCIDFDNDEITIRWLKSKHKAKHRVIPLHVSLKASMWMYTAKMKYDSLLFPVSRQRVYQLTQQHGFGNPHKIRHSFAVNFLRQSMSPMALVELQQLLGHAKIETTMKYLRVVPMQLKHSLKRIEFD